MIIEVRGGSAVIHLPSSFPSLSLRFCVESGRLFFPIIFPLIKKFIFFFSFPEQNNNNFRFNIVIFSLVVVAAAAAAAGRGRSRIGSRGAFN